MYIIYNTMDFSILNKTISLVAKRNSGKSVLLKYLVEQEIENFKKVFVICPTNFNGFYNDWIQPNCIFTTIYTFVFLNYKFIFCSNMIDTAVGLI